MPQRTFTNKDLNKPLKGSSRTYTNADLDVEDDFQPDDFTPDSVEDDFVPDDEPVVQSATPINENAPDTWREGFVNSITSGDALSAGLQGAKGFLKGATLDIPSTIGSGIKSIYKGIKDKYNNENQLDIDTPASGIDFSQAGSNPEEFGRMMGQMTGQPLVTMGMVKGAPGAIRTAGKAIEPTGRFIKTNRPFTSWIPPMAEPRMFTGLQRYGGRGLEYLGKKMKNVGKKSDKVIPTSIEELVEGESIAPIKSTKVIRTETPPKVKPRMRTNGDGTFTNLDTGEIVNSKGQPIIEINGELTMDSPFFKRNRQ